MASISLRRRANVFIMRPLIHIIILCPLPSILASYHLLSDALCSSLRALAFSVPSRQNAFLPDIYSTCFLQMFIQISPYHWGFYYHRHPTSPLPGALYSIALISFSANHLPPSNLLCMVCFHFLERKLEEVGLFSALFIVESPESNKMSDTQ